jgi:hypothetical protein
MNIEIPGRIRVVFEGWLRLTKSYNIYTDRALPTKLGEIFSAIFSPFLLLFLMLFLVFLAILAIGALIASAVSAIGGGPWFPPGDLDDATSVWMVFWQVGQVVYIIIGVFAIIFGIPALFKNGPKIRFTWQGERRDD